MPPPTSPTSPQSPTHNRPLTPLSYLSSPVPNFAATLSTEAADRADEANVSFLRDSLEELEQGVQPSRTRIDPQRDPRRPARVQQQSQAHTQPSPAQSRHETPEDLSRREGLQRVLSRLNRLHEPAAPSTSAYSNRTPSPNRQSLYDWAPSYNDNDQQENELDAILSELRRQQPDTHPDILRVLSQSQLDGNRVQREGNGTPAPGTTAAEAAERRDRLRERERRRRETEWVSLRTRAAIQRSRQEGSPSATERMLRYVMERERSGMSEEEERARGSGWFRPSPSRSGNEESRSATGGEPRWVLPPSASEARDRERQERIEAFRRGYLAENVPSRLPRVSTPPASNHSVPPNASSQFLENALRYLSDLRSMPSSEGMDSAETRDREGQVLSVSMDHGLATKELWADKHDDFIMDLQSLEPLADSSWLQPATVFDGHQHATNPCITHNARSRSGTVTHVLEQINPDYASNATTMTGFDHPPGSTRIAPPPSDASRLGLSHQLGLPNHYSLSNPSKQTQHDAQHDQWPVRVTLHSIQAAQMTLQGTMEAYDVPQHSVGSLSMLNPATERPKAGKKNAPIVTYLEGQIIDFTTHSFLTPEPPQGSGKSASAANPPSTPSNTLASNIAFPSATPQSDAANWRKLPPFSLLPSDDECARLLLSRARMHEVNQQYIFVRWKERCFVHGKDDKCDAADRNGDHDRGHGLTISGFYYVSLRREDGLVEGLYFDPSSTPYQHLRLKGVTRGWPAVGFR